MSEKTTREQAAEYMRRMVTESPQARVIAKARAILNDPETTNDTGDELTHGEKMRQANEPRRNWLGDEVPARATPTETRSPRGDGKYNDGNHAWGKASPQRIEEHRAMVRRIELAEEERARERAAIGAPKQPIPGIAWLDEYMKDERAKSAAEPVDVVSGADLAYGKKKEDQ